MRDPVRSLFLVCILVGSAFAQAGGPGYDQDQAPATPQIESKGQKNPPLPKTDAPDAAAEEPAPIRINVDLVNIFYTVRAKKGGQIDPNLDRKDFQIFENGKEQKIKDFTRESNLPLTLGLLIDISASQERLIDIEQQAATQFFYDVVRPKDQALLISFGKSVDLLQDFTQSAKLLASALKGIKGDGGTPVISGGPIPNVNTGPIGGSVGTPKGTLLFDAIYLVCHDKLRSEVGRKAIVLITDGEDQGSNYRLRDAIEAAQKADVIVYSIYYVDRAFYGGAGFGITVGGGASDLKKMAEETGGRMFTVDKKHPLAAVFKEIQDELRNQYAITYTPSDSNRHGEFRKIEIKVDKPEDKVQARDGYYATVNDDQ